MQLFPSEFASILECPTCRTILDVESASRCSRCARGFETEQGGRLVSLLKVAALVGDSCRERELRDAQAARGHRRECKEVLSNPHDSMEMGPTLEWLGVTGRETILELGCGTGRYTELLAGKGCHVLAMDFSKQALLKLEGTLQALGTAKNVGLVNASIGDFSVAPHSFDIVFSTLTSNLPDRSHRQAMYALAATALKPGGRFVFSSHHYGLGARWTKTPKTGVYQDGGIFREYLTAAEIRAEAAGDFKTLRMKPVQIYLPILSRNPAFRVRISRWAEKVPLLRQFGRLLLMEATAPSRLSPGLPAQSRRQALAARIQTLAIAARAARLTP